MNMNSKETYLQPEFKAVDLALEHGVLTTSGENLGSNVPFEDWDD